MVAAKILLVEDEGLIRMMTAEYLRDEGFEVVEAWDGDEAARLLDACDGFDVLFTDVRMPGMSGPELQRELLSRRLEIPIIFITAHGDEEVISRVMGDGAVDCLLKPFSEESLLKAIGLALSA